MTTKIQTNKLIIKFFYENIHKDFFIYNIKTNKDFKEGRNRVFDEIKQQLNAKSVVYITGHSFFALFGKEINKQNLDKRLKEYQAKNSDISFFQIENLQKANELSYFANFKRNLAQLLFNYLANIYDNYNNITGSLYYPVEYISKYKQYKTLKINIDKNNCLQIDVNTFTSTKHEQRKFGFKRKNDFEKAAKYVIESSTHKMRRRLRNEKENIFIKRQLVEFGSRKKNIITYLHFTDYSQFKVSKIGILDNFIKDTEEHLSKYLNVTFEYLNISERIKYKNKSTKEKDKRISNYINNKTINIIDFVENEKSEKLITQLKEVLKTETETEKYKYKPDKVSLSKKIKKNAVNFIIVHNKAFYKSEKDPYKKYSNIVTHHLTPENFVLKNKKATIDTIIKECYIKNDIINKQLSLTNWNYGEWNFIVHTEYNKEEQKKTKVKIKNLYRLTIQQNGELVFTKIDAFSNLWDNSEFSKYEGLYRQLIENENQNIEGLIISNTGDINKITKTTVRTLPDFKYIGNRLTKLNADFSIKNKELQKLFQKFAERNDKFSVKVNSTLTNLKSLPDNYKIDREILGKQFEKRRGRYPYKEDFADFFEEETGYVFMDRMRVQERSNKYLSSNLDVCYSNISKNKAFYFAGEKSTKLKFKFANATIIREVETIENSKLLLQHLLETLNVDFVKNGQLTVLPFPFKYLREFIKMEKA